MKFVRRVAIILFILGSGLLQNPPSVFGLPPSVLPISAAPSLEAPIYFKATGHSLGGKFRRYWETHGGLALYGYPLTPEFYEQGFIVQYFERNRFEYHPELAGTAYEVLLGRLGSQRLELEGRLPVRPANPSPITGAQFFPETGFSLGGVFAGYWQRKGGLAQFGFPITPEIAENGRNVQYFERARFEWFPEYRGTDYEVLLGLLGRDLADRLEPALRDRWAENPPEVSLKLESSPAPLAPLAPIIITANLDGELRLLGSDNRQYAAYNLVAGVPRTAYAAGAPGLQSVLFYRQGEIVTARWNSLNVAPPQNGILSGDPVWDGMYQRVKGFLEKDVVVYYSPQDGKPIRGYRSPDTPFLWLRDHVHQAKAFKFFETDLKSTLDYFRTTQRPDGSFDDYIQHYPGYEVYKAQIEIEADREYLFVEGVWTTFQATGDDDWLKANLAAMERGLEHTFTDPRRWSSELGLVKRGFTIDTWDFEQGSAGFNIRRSFDAQTRWSVMHGDNTGAYMAARRLAQIERYLGRPTQAALWESRAANLLQNLNRLAWNGQFYTHQLHLTPVDPTGIDEKTQLSLSNAYALNRGTLSPAQAAALIRTYQARRVQNNGRIFAEWYSIDPPFAVGFGPPGQYVNGGVMPLVGGELARGAFEYGFEAYGVDILQRYWQLLDRSGGSYLWYFPDGRPGIGTEATLPTDGWGAAAMLNALTEGLAGVTDNGKLYRDVTLSPRWAITDRTQAQVTLGYGASGAYFSYRWQRQTDKALTLTWGGAQTQKVNLHLLLPPNFVPKQLLVNGEPQTFSLSQIESSLYLDTNLPANGQLEVRGSGKAGLRTED